MVVEGSSDIMCNATSNASEAFAHLFQHPGLVMQALNKTISCLKAMLLRMFCNQLAGDDRLVQQLFADIICSMKAWQLLDCSNQAYSAANYHVCLQSSYQFGVSHGKLLLALSAAGLLHLHRRKRLIPAILIAGDPEEWDRLLAINVSAPQRLIRYLCGPMVEREQGYVINIGSTNGLKPSAATPAYSASKWAMRGYSLGVTEVSPEQQTDTPMFRQILLVLSQQMIV